MSHRSVLTLVATLTALTAGCAGTRAQAPETRMVASASRLVVEVDGKGTVDLGSTACAEARCAVEWDKVADPVLVADAAPGWRFERWEAPAQADSMADPTQPRVYRAVFRRLGTEVAKR